MSPSTRLAGPLLVLAGLLVVPAAVPPAAAGTVEAGPAMAAARVRHSATVLPGGRVLVFGGTDPGDPLHRRGELFDEPTGTWTATAPAPVEVTGHATTVLLDGRVLVTGGGDASTRYGTHADAMLYDPVTDEWTAAAPMSARRAGHLAVRLPDGRVLVVGGGTAETWSPLTGRWTQVPVPPLQRPAQALLPSGDVLVTGESATHPWEPAAYLLDAETGTTREAAAPPDASAEPLGATMPDGEVAWSVSYQGHSTWLYDEGADAWRPAGRLWTADQDEGRTATVLPTGEVLFAGGWEPYDVETLEVYDPETDLARRASGDSFSRRGHAAARLPSGRVLLAGGREPGGPTASTVLYRHDRVAPVPVVTGGQRVRFRAQQGWTRTPGRATTTVAELVAEATGEPVGGEVVELSRRPRGGREWVSLGTAVTDAFGRVRFGSVAEPGVYAVRHRATPAAGPAAFDLVVDPPRSVPGLDDPTAVHAYEGDGEALVRWGAPRVGESGTVTRLVVRLTSADRPTAADSPQHTVEVEVPTSAREARLGGLRNGIPYLPTVHAFYDDRYESVGAGQQVVPRPGGPAAPPPAVAGTRACGVLPPGLTRWTAADSPVQVCRGGLLVGPDSVLEVDGGAGPVVVRVEALAAIRAEYGAVRVLGGDAGRVTFEPAERDGWWTGFEAGQGRYDDGRSSSAVRVESADVRGASGVRAGGPVPLVLRDVSLSPPPVLPPVEPAGVPVVDVWAGAARLDSVRVDAPGMTAVRLRLDPLDAPAHWPLAEPTTVRCLDVGAAARALDVYSPRPVVVLTDASFRNDGVALANADTPVRTVGAWWGQPLGPRPGQVTHPDRHEDVLPRVAPPPCPAPRGATLPAAPYPVAAPREGSVRLSWATVDGAASYEVRRDGVPVHAGAGTSVTLGGLVPGRDHTFDVVTVAADGRRSPPRPVVVRGSVLTLSVPGETTYGDAYAVSGRLADAGGRGLAGRPVRVYRRPVGRTAWSLLTTVATGRDGAWSLRNAPPAHAEYLAVFAGADAHAGSRSAAGRVLVRTRVAMSVSRSGGTVTLRGWVAPGHPGMAVQVHELAGGVWRRVGGAVLTPGSGYAVTLRPARGRHTYRVVAPWHADHATGYSARATVDVP